MKLLGCAQLNRVFTVFHPSNCVSNSASVSDGVSDVVSNNSESTSSLLNPDSSFTEADMNIFESVIV